MVDENKIAIAQANKQLMLDFYERVFNNWDTFKKYRGEYYV